MDEISDKELAVLASLYDRFAHALDPFSENRDLAEKHFYDLVTQLRCKHAPGLDERTFMRGVVARCKKYLAKTVNE